MAGALAPVAAVAQRARSPVRLRPVHLAVPEHGDAALRAGIELGLDEARRVASLLGRELVSRVAGGARPTPDAAAAEVVADCTTTSRAPAGVLRLCCAAHLDTTGLDAWHVRADAMQRLTAVAAWLSERGETGAWLLDGTMVGAPLQAIERALQAHGVARVLPLSSGVETRSEASGNPLAGVRVAAVLADPAARVTPNGRLERRPPDVWLTGTAEPDRGTPPAGRQAWAVDWDRELERFGASEVNERFEDATRTAMTSAAWAGWLAVRIATEAMLRTAVSAQSPAEWLSSARLDGHKGVALSFDDRRQLAHPLAIRWCEPARDEWQVWDRW